MTTLAKYEENPSSPSSGPASEMLGPGTLIEAIQAISREIDLDSLLSTTIKTVVRIASAQSGFLFLLSNGQLRVEASTCAGTGEVDVLQSTPIEECQTVSTAIVRHVNRTGETVVLHDAAKEGMFVHDPCIAERQPRSVLCMPVRRQDESLGVLYLENSRTADAFAQDRVEVLNILVAQAAISLASAKLYDDLKREIDDRRVAEAELRRYRNHSAGVARERTAGLEAPSEQPGPEIAGRTQLEGQIRGSPERRERQILASTRMSQEIAVVNEEAELYKRAVALVKEQLGYYHAQMFRTDPLQEAAVLVAGYGRVGRQMLDEGYQVPAGAGAVGAAALGTSVLRPDIASDPNYRLHPHLPHVKGELAVPIKLDQWDAHAQVMAVKSFVDGHFDGFAVVAIDEVAVLPVVKEAMDRGLCVVSTNRFGRGNQTAEIGFSDYENGYMLGEQAGEWAKKHLSPDETLNLAMFNSPHLAEIVQREVGIMAGVRSEFPNVRLVDTAATSDPIGARPVAQRWLEVWPDLHMILGINDSGALGAYAAVIAAGKNDADTFFIGGIDATDEALTAIGEGGLFQATIDQSPREVGVLAVRTLVAAIAGRPYETKTVIVGTPVNRDNLGAFLAQRQNRSAEESGALDDLDLSDLKIGMNVIDLKNPFFVAMAEAAMGEARRLGVHLLINDSRQVLGVLSVQSDKAGALDAEDQLVLEGLCGQIATAVKSLRLFGELKQAYDGLERRVEERTAELRQSEERFRVLAENIPGVIYLCRNDERWTMLFLNDAVEELTGYPKEDFLSDQVRFADLYHPEDSELVFAQVEAALAERAPFHLVYRLRHRSGEWRWIEEIGVGIYHDGELYMVEGFLTDITERRQTEEAMVRASRLEATATLAGGIAHQFNNLMVGVLGYAEMLKADLAWDASALGVLDTISTSAQQAGELAQQMLAFARGGKYQPRVMNLNDAVRGVLYAQESLLPARIDVALDLASDLWNVEADLAQVSQVLLNVLTNAVEAIEGSGRITIATRNFRLDDTPVEDLEAGPYVCLSVQDTGHGMSAEVQARIFEPFFTTKFQGRGLGLAAVYGIVRNHGGHIVVDSKEGHGTTIEIHLPAIRPRSAEPSARTSVTKEPGGPTDEGLATVLVIEDEETVQKLVKRMLQRRGYRVLVASDGQQAVEIARTDAEIDVALLDIEMPSQRGTATYPLLMEARPGLKTILCSGYELDDQVQALLDAGARAFIHKPFDVFTLETEIRRVLGC
jgi:two-component system cell cycle sensor histidine kinase/response regulator CckA